MENLHADVLENILFRLPVDATIQAKRVCTTWRAIIRKKTENPGGFLFTHAVGDHHDYKYKLKQLFYEDEYDDYHPSDNRFITEIERSRSITYSVSKHFMVGSCNGLVCFGRENNSKLHPFVICNPLTGESVFLPPFDYSEWPEDALSTRIGHLASGFGYCPSTNEYKVVTILKYKKHEQEEGYVQVYTVGGGWRYIGFTYRCAFNYSSGVYANGALFWLHRRSTRRVQESEVEAFDLEGEKFHNIALPRSKDFEYRDNSSFPLKLLAGNNNLYLVHSVTGASRTDIWVYKRDDRNWLKEFSVRMNFPRSFEAFAITRSNAVLWICDKGKSLHWYDPKTSTVKKNWDDKSDGTEPVYVEAIPHTQSNVSLKDLGETNVTFFDRFWPSFQA